MGRQPQPKRADYEALSLHTTPEDYDYDDLPAPADLPPSYADSEFAASSSTAEPIRPVPPPNTGVLTKHTPEDDEYSPMPRWTGWIAKLEPVPIESKQTKIRVDERLQDPYRLYAYVMDHLRRLPPNPTMRIHGYHYKTKRGGRKRRRSEKRRVTDFDIEISLQPLLRHAFDEDTWSETVITNDESAYRGSFRRTRASGHGQGIQITDVPAPDLKEWCEQYCADRARWKVFRVRREVTGLDHDLLRTMACEMVRSTDYDGQLEVTFPTYEQNIDIYSPHWVNLWRTSWISYLFYFTMLWIVTWPLLFFITKWWCVYTVSWSASIDKPDPADPRRTSSTHACMSEQAWFALHRNDLRHLVLQRHQGAADGSARSIMVWNRLTGLSS